VEEQGDNSAGTESLWLIDHCCRVCFGRLFERTDEREIVIVRCTSCGTEVHDDHQNLCCCGVKAADGVTPAFRCIRHKPVPELPAEVICESLIPDDLFERGFNNGKTT